MRDEEEKKLTGSLVLPQLLNIPVPFSYGGVSASTWPVIPGTTQQQKLPNNFKVHVTGTTIPAHALD